MQLYSSCRLFWGLEGPGLGLSKGYSDHGFGLVLEGLFPPTPGWEGAALGAEPLGLERALSD